MDLVAEHVTIQTLVTLLHQSYAQVYELKNDNQDAIQELKALLAEKQSLQAELMDLHERHETMCKEMLELQGELGIERARLAMQDEIIQAQRAYIAGLQRDLNRADVQLPTIPTAEMSQMNAVGNLLPPIRLEPSLNRGNGLETQFERTIMEGEVVSDGEPVHLALQHDEK